MPPPGGNRTRMEQIDLIIRVIRIIRGQNPEYYGRVDIFSPEGQ